MTMLSELLAANLPTDDCVLYPGWIDKDGYAKAHHGMVHRLAYELHVGPIPDGLEIDHLCHSRDAGCDVGSECKHRRCVNPAHLEPVTKKVNAERGMKSRQVACVNGHPFDSENTYRRSGARGQGQRGCRACNAAAVARYKAKKMSAALA